MALNTEPTYSTWVQFKTYTPVSTQKSIAEATWKPFALRAEKILDSYVTIAECFRYSASQNLKFPIKDSNSASLIPDDVVLAVIEITSDLVLRGDPSASDDLVETSEAWNGDGYSVSKQQKTNSSSSDDIKIEMPPLARRLLMPWTNKVASLKY
ncbi:MAG: hypothetical protein V4549_03470 [Bacteroidota bacterium]